MAVQTVAAGAKLSTRIFEPNNPSFQESFDEKPFEFRHNFTSDHPLFSRERLRRLLSDPAMKENVYTTLARFELINAGTQLLSGQSQ